MRALNAIDKVMTRLRWTAMGPRSAAETMIAVDTLIAEHGAEAVAACEAEKARAPAPTARFLKLVCEELARLHRLGITARQALRLRKNIVLAAPPGPLPAQARQPPVDMAAISEKK